jgi:hypothetical protein
MPVSAVITRKMPAITPVAKTDFVCRYVQKVTANQTVKLMTDTSSVFTSRLKKTFRFPWIALMVTTVGPQGRYRSTEFRVTGRIAS